MWAQNCLDMHLHPPISSGQLSSQASLCDIFGRRTFVSALFVEVGVIRIWLPFGMLNMFSGPSGIAGISGSLERNL